MSLEFSEQLIEILSENVAVFSENVGWMGLTGSTGWLIVAVSWDVLSVVEEIVDLWRLLKFILSENVAAFSENVAWLGPTGWTEWLAVEVGSGVEEELLDLASLS